MLFFFFLPLEVSDFKAKSFKMPRHLLKDSEASDVAIYYWRPWWCSCIRYNYMSWFKNASNITTDEIIEHPPQTKKTLPKTQSWNQTNMATVESDWDLLWRCSFISQEVTEKGGREWFSYWLIPYIKGRSWNLTCGWTFKFLGWLSFGWFEGTAKTYRGMCSSDSSVLLSRQLASPLWWRRSIYRMHIFCCFQIWLLQYSGISWIESSKRKSPRSSRLLESHLSGMLFSLDSWNSKLNSLYARASLVTSKKSEVSRILAFYQQLHSWEWMCYVLMGLCIRLILVIVFVVSQWMCQLWNLQWTYALTCFHLADPAWKSQVLLQTLKTTVKLESQLLIDFLETAHWYIEDTWKWMFLPSHREFSPAVLK